MHVHICIRQRNLVVLRHNCRQILHRVLSADHRLEHIRRSQDHQVLSDRKYMDPTSHCFRGFHRESGQLIEAHQKVPRAIHIACKLGAIKP